MPDVPQPLFTEDGVPIVYSSPRPYGTRTMFTGAGDGTGVGDGPRLLFKMLSTDVSKSVDLTFSEKIYIKDGYIIVDSAPFGAYIDIDIVHPTAGIVGSFGKKIPVFGSGWFPLDAEDKGGIEQGLILRITVHNSTGVGAEDPASDFKLAGRIELYRANTI